MRSTNPFSFYTIDAELMLKRFHPIWLFILPKQPPPPPFTFNSNFIGMMENLSITATVLENTVL